MIWYTRLTRELLSQKEFNHLRWSNSERSLCCLGINLNYLYSFLTSYRFVRCGETLFGKSSLELITHQHFFFPSPKNLDHTGISPKIGTLNSKCANLKIFNVFRDGFISLWCSWCGYLHWNVSFIDQKVIKNPSVFSMAHAMEMWKIYILCQVSLKQS